MKILREPYGYSYAEKTRLKETYGGPDGHVFVECMRIRPETGESRTVILFSHPIGGGSFLPMVTALARAGRHVIYCNTRYRGNDTALILEKCVLDLGACIADLKTRFGYEKVLLGGWSGGGSLSLFYQDQAEHPTITETPAGDPVDLLGAALVPADGVMLLAAHISRSVTLTEWLDPSILDEDPPVRRRDCGARHLQPRLPRPAALRRRFRGPLPRGSDRPQPAGSRPARGSTLAALKASGDPDMERPLRGLRHHVRRALDRPDAGSVRPPAGDLLPGRAQDRQRRAGGPRPLHHSAQLAFAVEL